MEDIKEIINALGPSSGGMAWSLALYWMFLINLVILFVDGSAFGTNISIAVLLCVFIDKTFAFGYMFNSSEMDPEYCHTKIFIGTYLIRVAMFAGPFAVAGSTEKGKVRAIAILAGLSGIGYMFIRWFYDQRKVDAIDVTCYNTEMLIQTAGMGLVLAKIALRDRLPLGAIHRHIPITVPRELATHEIEI